MKVHTMEQRTPEWDAIRKGKITASVATKMITTTGKPSTQVKPFIGRLLAEQYGLQEPEPITLTEDVQRGIDQENESRLWFQVETGLKAQECGFIESDDGLSGFSPDGYVVVDGVIIPLELKNPKPSTHIGYLLEGKLPVTYKQQCHFALVVSEAPYMYFMSYCHGLPSHLVKVVKDDYTDKVSNALEDFKQTLESAKQIINQGE